MRKLLLGFWRDDQGALIATEYLFVVSILIIGLVLGLKAFPAPSSGLVRALTMALSRAWGVGNQKARVHYVCWR